MCYQWAYSVFKSSTKPYECKWNGFNVYYISGVVALFTLPKVYETNQEQIDQNLALVQAKINEITAK